MAYNNGFPVNYPYYQQPIMPQMQQPVQQPMIQAQPQQPTQQYPVMQGGFVRVRNENEARTYFVAPGNSVTFIDDDSRYIFTKTVNMGQLDRPIFEKYRLVKEEDASTATDGPVEPPKQPQVDLSQYALKADVAAFQSEIDAIRADIETFRGDLYGLAGKKRAVKKEAATDE